MSIRVYWDEKDSSIVRWDMEGKWTWDEFFQAQNELHALMQDCPHPVDVIADQSKSKFVPGDAFVNFRRAQRTALPNRRHIVIIGAGGFVNTMVSTFDRVILRHSPRRLFVVETLEEAYKVLEEHR